jgi:hypothetical protein
MPVTPGAGRDTAKRFGVSYDWIVSRQREKALQVASSAVLLLRKAGQSGAA